MFHGLKFVNLGEVALKEIFYKIIKIGVANLFIVLLVFVILEGGASFYFAYQDVRQEIKKEPFVAERLHTEYDPLLGWINKPNISINLKIFMKCSLS